MAEHNDDGLSTDDLVVLLQSLYPHLPDSHECTCRERVEAAIHQLAKQEPTTPKPQQPTLTPKEAEVVAMLRLSVHAHVAFPPREVMMLIQIIDRLVETLEFEQGVRDATSQ